MKKKAKVEKYSVKPIHKKTIQTNIPERIKAALVVHGD